MHIQLAQARSDWHPSNIGYARRALHSADQRLGADPRSNTQISLGSSGVPETFVIDGRGTIRHQYVGPLTEANIPGVLEQLAALK